MAKPIDFKDSNILFTGEGCNPLPARRGDDGILCCWELTPAERARVFATGRVWVHIKSVAFPPMIVMADDKD